MGSKNVEYQNGMFIVSNPADATELVRNLRSNPVADYTSDPALIVTNCNNADNMPQEIAACLATIEEKLHQQEISLIQEFRSIANTLTATLRQALEHQESERSRAETQWQKALAERGRWLLEEIGAKLEKQREKVQQPSWWNKLFDNKAKV